MTYGWAILVILIVGVVLWQMGVFNPASTPPGCSGFSHIVPVDTKLSGDKLQVFVTNEAGTRLEVTVAPTATIGSSSPVTGTIPGLMRPGSTKDINFTLSNSFTSGEYYRANIVISYTNQLSGMPHKSSGYCWGNVE